MRLFTQLSIRGKLLLILGLIFIIAMLLGLAWSKKSMEAIEANAIEYSLQIVKQTNDRLDSYFEEIERLSLPMLSNKLTLDFLTDSGSDPYIRYITADSIEKELFPTLTLNRPDIYAVSLVSDKNLASSSLSYMSAEERYSEYRSRIPIIGRFQVMGLQKVISGDKFTLAMRFVDARSSVTTGMLIIDLNMDQIEGICKGIHLGKTGFIWMADPNGKIIYHPDSSMISGNVPSSYLQHFEGERYGYYISASPQGKKLIIFNRSEHTGLTMVSEVFLDELNASLISLSKIAMITALAVFLVLILVVGGFGYSLTKSLLLLQRLMKRAEIGDFTVLAPPMKESEIGSLYRGFNKMVTEIKRLIEVVQVAAVREKVLEVKQKDAVLQAMQLQINPHFLYNTLEVINSNAILEGNFSISKMIVALGDMFRYSVGNPNTLVTLGDELTHIRSYLEIQQERFESLQIFIEIPEKDLIVPAVRLMLQPIVENSFKHGYDKHKLQPGHIEIIGELDTEAYVLRISDKGKGMSEEVLDAYNKAFLSFDENHSVDSQKETLRIGLLNVNYRIRMLLGEAYGLSIANSSEQGTSVVIRLPLPNSNRRG